MGAKKTAEEGMIYSADQVYAAAAYAHLKNGMVYLAEEKHIVGDDAVTTHPANKTILQDALENQSVLTEEHYELGREARAIIRGLLFKKLSGEVTSELVNNLLKNVEKEWHHQHDRFGLPAYAIAYAMAKKNRDRVDDEIRFSTSNHFAAVGERVSLSATVLKCNFSKLYGIYYVTVKSDTGNIIWFSLRNEIAPGSNIRLRGSVKRLTNDGQTQLSRVLVLATQA